MSKSASIVCRNVRTHNLKNVDAELPLGRWIAITGVSGSGKSSFAFDTLFSESQRRFLETLGTYERQFLAGLPQGDFDSIDPVPPAIALKQTNRSADPRSVVGTSSDIIYPLRTLFAALMDPCCSTCGGPILIHEPGHLANYASSHKGNYAVCVKISLSKGQGKSKKTKDQSTQLKALLTGLQLEGYTRVHMNGELFRMEDIAESGNAQFNQVEELDLALDLFGEDEDMDDILSRAQSIWEQVRLSDRFGSVELINTKGSKSPSSQKKGASSKTSQQVQRFHIKPWCTQCDSETRVVESGDLDWQSTMGSCSTCQGIGNIPVLDPEKIIPNPTLSLKQGAIKPWSGENYAWAKKQLLAMCKKLKIQTDKPYAELPKREQTAIWTGSDGDYVSIEQFFKWLEEEKYKQSSRILLAKYRKYKTCPDCLGARIGPSGRHAMALGATYDDLFNGEIRLALKWVESAGEALEERSLLALTETQKEILIKMQLLNDLGLGSSSLSRRSKSLSGGEYQRVLLSRVLGNGLSDALYVLDEPSVGLGKSEIPALIKAIERLRDFGNTIVMVEHEPSLVSSADYWIEFGPEGGSGGGQIIGQGQNALTDKSGKPVSLEMNTERLLFPRRKSVPPTVICFPDNQCIRLKGFSHLNCEKLLMEIPIGALTVIAGPSGAGKTTLLRAGLDSAIQEFLDTGRLTSTSDDVDAARGRWDRLDLPADFASRYDLVSVAQRAMHRSITSVPATTLGLMDEIRRAFAATLEAKERGFSTSDFTFNGAGSCPVCEGRGILKDDLFFLGEVEKTCEECAGTRFRSDVLEVRFKGRNVAEWLAASLSECASDGLFARSNLRTNRGPHETLELCVRLGIGHLPLGIPTSQLSGGEAQRLRIAASLTKKAGSLVSLIDEPTRGLSESDIGTLIEAIQELTSQGHTFVVVEHHEMFQKAANQLLVMGPGAGTDGGQICERQIQREIREK